MNEPRPFASLTSSLLARKGFARPAMRPQGHALTPNQDDLGWNDMGSYESHDEPHIAPASYLTPLPGGADIESFAAATPLPVVHRQQAEIAQEFGARANVEEAALVVAAPVKAAKPVAKRKAIVAKPRAGQSAQPARAKAAFTLRLDPERHLRLRLACAMGHRSAQRLLINALDAYLDDIPGLDAIAASLPNGHTA